MRIAVRFIYYQPVTPSMDIIDLDDKTWTEFLYADNSRRREIACSLLSRPHLLTHIREVAWIPLSDQSLLRESNPNLKPKPNHPSPNSQ